MIVGVLLTLIARADMNPRMDQLDSLSICPLKVKQTWNKELNSVPAVESSGRPFGRVKVELEVGE